MKIDEHKIKALYGKNYTYEKIYTTEVNLSQLTKNQSVCFGDGKTYYWLLTKKSKEE